jgi:hypothetical protein
MDQNKLNEILIEHGKWLNDPTTGKRANLGNADLRDANLRYANLGSIDLRGADLGFADLGYANLKNADLGFADLGNADLRNADLRDANLEYAHLINADLRYANLRDANLEYAHLENADLENADLKDAMLPDFQKCPDKGIEFKGYKKLDDESVIEVIIPSHADRTSCLVSNKCRASSMIVSTEGVSQYNTDYHYKIGENFPDLYDPDIRIDCTHGLHFFMTYKEAKEY